MKIRTDLSSSGRFTIWESGGWHRDGTYGSSVIIANADGSRPDVIFDTDPQQNVTHACFFAEQGMLVAGAFLRPTAKPGVYNGQIGLHRISELTTTIIQGQARPKAVTELMWLRSVNNMDETVGKTLSRLENTSDDLYAAQVNLLTVAFHKAASKSEDQKIFWGNPRNNRPDYSSSRLQG